MYRILMSIFKCAENLMPSFIIIENIHDRNVYRRIYLINCNQRILKANKREIKHENGFPIKVTEIRLMNHG